MATHSLTQNLAKSLILGFRFEILRPTEAYVEHKPVTTCPLNQINQQSLDLIGLVGLG